MTQILTSIPLFISIITLFFFFFITDKRDPRVRFVPYILLSFIARSGFVIFIYYKRLLSPEFDIASPPLTMLSLSLIFLFILELINHKHVSKSTLFINLSPTIIATAFYLLFIVSEEWRIKLEFANFILKNAIGFSLAVIYFIIVYIKLLKTRRTHPHQKLISLLLLQLGIILALYAIAFVFIYKTKEIYTLPLNLLKLMEISITLSLYFYCFNLYKDEIQKSSTKRYEGFLSSNSISPSPLTLKEPIIQSSDIIESINRNTSNNESDDPFSNYQKEIEHFFDSSLDFLDPLFTQQKLADQLGIPRYNISQVFNVKLGISFSDFLNSKRINYACSILKESPSTPISQMAEKVGYKSRTTFYSNFKKVTGYTPKEYISLLENK